MERGSLPSGSRETVITVYVEYGDQAGQANGNCASNKNKRIYTLPQACTKTATDFQLRLNRHQNPEALQDNTSLPESRHHMHAGNDAC